MGGDSEETRNAGDELNSTQRAAMMAIAGAGAAVSSFVLAKALQNIGAEGVDLGGSFSKLMTIIHLPSL
eukprot:g57042.t1